MKVACSQPAIAFQIISTGGIKMANWFFSGEWTQILTIGPTTMLVSVTVMWIGRRLGGDGNR